MTTGDGFLAAVLLRVFTTADNQAIKNPPKRAKQNTFSFILSKSYADFLFFRAKPRPARPKPMSARVEQVRVLDLTCCRYRCPG